jgi:hypothetical protein
VKRTKEKTDRSETASTGTSSSPAAAAGPVRPLRKDVAELRIVLVFVHVVDADMP